MWSQVQMSILHIHLQKGSVLCCCFLQVWDWSHPWEAEKAGERPEYQRAGAKGERAAFKDVGAEAHRAVQQPSEFLISPSSPWPTLLSVQTSARSSGALLLRRRSYVFPATPLEEWTSSELGIKKREMASERRDEKNIKALRVNVCHW